jgi:hypothetical protein
MQGQNMRELSRRDTFRLVSATGASAVLAATINPTAAADDKRKSDIVDETGFVRKLWAWDYLTPWDEHVKGFFVLFQPHRTPEKASLWFVDNPRLEALLVAAYTTGQMVSVTSHKQVESLGPMDLQAKTKPALKAFPIIDVVVVPPHPGEPR